MTRYFSKKVSMRRKAAKKGDFVAKNSEKKVTLQQKAVKKGDFVAKDSEKR